jgi:hypothetical protein
MTTFTVVPVDVLRDVRARIAHAVVSSKIDTFVLDRAPDPFDEDVVTPSPLSVHGQLYAMAHHCVDELPCSVLATLVSVDDPDYQTGHTPLAGPRPRAPPPA